jgi:hypothetical protein
MLGSEEAEAVLDVMRHIDWRLKNAGC